MIAKQKLNFGRKSLAILDWYKEGLGGRYLPNQLVGLLSAERDEPALKQK